MAPSTKEGENLRRLRNCPVCIICGRPGEAKQIAIALGIVDNVLRGHEVAEFDNSQTFYYGSFELAGQSKNLDEEKQTGNGKLDYVLTSGTRQGIQSFTVHAALLLHILRPKFVIHAGVCAGYRDEANKRELGHVVFGEAALNFEEGKFMHDKDRGIVFMPDYNIINVRAGDMQAFADDNAREDYHYGDYISGSAVRSDAALIFEKIRSQARRNAIALDMEASAFLELCQHSFKDISCLGVVKGISDFGDEHKNVDPHDKIQALEKTANALRDWITHSIPKITWEPDYSKEPVAEIVPGYYDNFIRRVLDNVAQGLPISRKAHHNSQINRADIKGCKIVLPRANQPREYKEMGPISAATQKYSIEEVEVGGEHGKRSLYYKAGYLIDFPRTVNKYSDYYDAVYQVEVFGRLLERTDYFKVSTSNIGATVCPWADFEAWLKSEVPGPDASGPDASGPDASRPDASEPPPSAIRQRPKTRTFFGRKSPDRGSAREGARKHSFPNMLNRFGSGQDLSKLQNGTGGQERTK